MEKAWIKSSVYSILLMLFIYIYVCVCVVVSGRMREIEKVTGVE